MGRPLKIITENGVDYSITEMDNGVKKVVGTVPGTDFRDFGYTGKGNTLEDVKKTILIKYFGTIGKAL